MLVSQPDRPVGPCLEPRVQYADSATAGDGRPSALRRGRRGSASTRDGPRRPQQGRCRLRRASGAVAGRHRTGRFVQIRRCDELLGHASSENHPIRAHHCDRHQFEHLTSALPNPHSMHSHGQLSRVTRESHSMHSHASMPSTSGIDFHGPNRHVFSPWNRFHQGSPRSQTAASAIETPSRAPDSQAAANLEQSSRTPASGLRRQTPAASSRYRTPTAGGQPPARRGRRDRDRSRSWSAARRPWRPPRRPCRTAPAPATRPWTTATWTGAGHGDVVTMLGQAGQPVADPGRRRSRPTQLLGGARSAAARVCNRASACSGDRGQIGANDPMRGRRPQRAGQNGIGDDVRVRVECQRRAVQRGRGPGRPDRRRRGRARPAGPVGRVPPERRDRRPGALHGVAHPRRRARPAIPGRGRRGDGHRRTIRAQRRPADARPAPATPDAAPPAAVPCR